MFTIPQLPPGILVVISHYLPILATEFSIYARVQLFISSFCSIFYFFASPSSTLPLVSLCSCDSVCLCCFRSRDLCSDIAALTGGLDGRGDKAGWAFIDQMRLTIMDSFDRACAPAAASIGPSHAAYQLHFQSISLTALPHFLYYRRPSAQCFVFESPLRTTVSEDWS